MTVFPKADVQNVSIGIELMSALGRKQTFWILDSLSEKLLI